MNAAELGLILSIAVMGGFIMIYIKKKILNKHLNT